MATQTSTVKQRLLDALLDGGLERFVQDRRTAGKSWREIEYDVAEATGERVTFESLRAWFPDAEATEVAS